MLKIVRVCSQLCFSSVTRRKNGLIRFMLPLLRYCQCFAGKSVCSSSCRCVNCANTDSPDNADLRHEAIKSILLRNPQAFDSKFKPVCATLTAWGPFYLAFIFSEVNVSYTRFIHAFCDRRQLLG